jgi:DNA-binding CsgD family transcriptional regulator
MLLSDAEELARMGCWALDLETLRGEWTPGMYRIHGREPDGKGPVTIERFLADVHPDDRDRVASLLEGIVLRPNDVPEDGVVTEYRVLLDDGSIRHVRVRGRIRRNVWMGAAQDVTDQHITEHELQAHYAVSQALSEWESFDEGVVALLRRLGTALDYPLGSLWVWEEQSQRFQPRAFWSTPEVDAEPFEALTMQTTLAAGEGVAGRLIETGRPVVAADLGEYLSPARAAAASRLGVRSGIAFSAVERGPPLAVVAFYALDRRETSERLIDTLTAIGNHLGRFLQQRRPDLEHRRLSDRELEILRCAAAGLSGPQIAERLFISPATVKTHFEHIYEKLGIGDRAAAVAHAIRTGIIA